MIHKPLKLKLLAIAMMFAIGQYLPGQVELKIDSVTVTECSSIEIIASIAVLDDTPELTAYDLTVEFGADNFGIPTGVAIANVTSMNADLENFSASYPSGTPFNFELAVSGSGAGTSLGSTFTPLFKITLDVSETFIGSDFAVRFEPDPTPNPALFALTLDGVTQNEADTLVDGLVTVRDLIPGDVNLDTVVNLLDVQPFITVLSSGGYQVEADINKDGDVDLLDVQPFVQLLTGGG